MIPETQQKAIAAALGWTDLWTAPVGDLRAKPELMGRSKPSHSYWKVPDYLDDLNACAEFKEVIEEEGRQDEYLQRLHEEVKNDGRTCWKVSEADHFACATAPAAARARAFLRAMDLWKGEIAP